MGKATPLSVGNGQNAGSLRTNVRLALSLSFINNNTIF